MLVTVGSPSGSVMLTNPHPAENFSFVFYCYQNNSLMYFFCNWLRLPTHPGKLENLENEKDEFQVWKNPGKKKEEKSWKSLGN